MYQKKVGCSFCHLGHLETAFAIGGDKVRTLIDNPSEELKPIYSPADKIVDNAVKEQDVVDFLN